NEAFATAYIVRRKVPSSGKPGDKAIITADGQIHGWIGGGCTRGIILKEALLSMSDRKARLVLISPEAKRTNIENTKIYNMTCQSGGEVEVYIEPVLPKPQLLIFGSSHIAMALAKIAKAMEYQVAVVMSSVDETLFSTADKIHALADFDSTKVTTIPYVIVCTQGEGDADAMAKALSLNASYLSFVASRKKANGTYNELRSKGIDFDQLKTIKTPAGLDIGAKTPEEVAISILAEIIQDFRKPGAEITISSTNDKQEKVPQINLMNEDYYINPVCNIPVLKASAKYVLEHEGESVYFCCYGCKVSFEADPAKYMVLK
ncbi:MAG: XdhC family protein, partial [Bacteroidota bacterium]